MGDYCPLCGNTGIMLDGSPCSCKAHVSELYKDVQCLDIPEAYRGLVFNKTLLPDLLGDVYKNVMGNYYEQVVSLRLRCKNVVICSPPQTGKSVFVYSAIQELFRQGIDVFPVFDVLEIKRIMLDIESNRQTSLGVTEPLRLLEVPYLFAVIPHMTVYDTYDVAAMLIARRVRRGNSTMLFYEGSWNQLIFNDTKGMFKSMKGNGSLGTFEVSSWQAKE